ncbi:MAG: hypothetical protein J6T16_05955 [Opitutales bacterium]|nr:hypothetical protein [Opitutales bacterium]
MKLNEDLKGEVLRNFKEELVKRIGRVRQVFERANCLPILENTVAEYCRVRGITRTNGDDFEDVKALLEVSQFCEKAFLEMLQTLMERQRKNDCANN